MTMIMIVDDGFLLKMNRVLARVTARDNAKKAPPPPQE